MVGPIFGILSHLYTGYYLLGKHFAGGKCSGMPDLVDGQGDGIKRKIG